MEPVKYSPPALQEGDFPRRAAEQKSLVLWRWCVVSLGKEALEGQPLPSLYFLHFSFNTTGKIPLFPSPMSVSRACSAGQTRMQPPAPVSSGTPGCHHPMGTAASSSSQHFAGSDLSTPLFGAGAACAEILCSSAITAKGPLASYYIPKLLGEPHPSTT